MLHEISIEKFNHNEENPVSTQSFTFAGDLEAATRLADELFTLINNVVEAEGGESDHGANEPGFVIYTDQHVWEIKIDGEIAGG